MSAPLGNQFWKARSKHGRERLFASADALWEACCEYFEWVEANPLYEMKAFAYQGVVVQEPVAKMRAMTIGGLCIFLDIDELTWRRWREVEDFCTVVSRAEQIIYQQKFTGAAADLLNPNIIARDLGLADKQDVTTNGESLNKGRTLDDFYAQSNVPVKP
jgi:hypothetical protein